MSGKSKPKTNGSETDLPDMKTNSDTKGNSANLRKTNGHTKNT